MLIGANRLFALPNVDDTERILPSSPQVKGEGHGRFESFLYNTSAPQEEVPDGGQKTRPEEGPETVASQLSSLFSMASKDGRLKLPSFASPMEEQEGTMVASKVEGTSEGDSDAYLADADSEINVEDIVSSQIDDLLSSLLGPMESQTDYSLGDTGPIKPRTDYPLGDTGPIEPQMRHYEAMAELSARPEIISPGGVSPVVDKPSASVIPLDQPTSSEVTTQADLIEPETVAPMAQLPTELPVTQIKFGQAVASNGDVVPLANPEGTPAASELQAKVEPIKPEAAAQPDRTGPETADRKAQLSTELPVTQIKFDQASATSGETALSAKPEVTPAVSDQQTRVESTKPDAVAQPDPTGPGTVDRKAQLSTELPVTQIKFDQIPTSRGEATLSAKPEGTPAVSDPQTKVESTKPEAAAQLDRTGPEAVDRKAQLSTELPVAQIKFDQAPTQSGEATLSAKPEGTPAVSDPQTKVESTKPEVAARAGLIEPETVAPKAQLSTELPVTQIKFDQAPTPSGEATLSAKPEGTPAVSDPQTKVDPIKPEVAAQAGLIEPETVAPKAQLSTELPVAEIKLDQAPAPSGEAAPSTKPEAAAQPNRLSPSDTAVVAEVVKPDPPTSIGLNVGGPSESVSPLDQPTLFEITTQADPIEPEIVIPKVQSSSDETPAASIKLEVGSGVKAGNAFAPSGEAVSSAKSGWTQPVSVIAEPAQVAQAATAAAQESIPHRVKIVTPRTVQSKGYSISAESASLSDMGEGRDNALPESKAKEAPMFLSSWTPEKREEKFQPVTERSENKPEASFQRAVDQGLENLVAQTDTRQSVQPKSEPVPTQTMYLPQKGSDALPHGLVQVVRHVMADGTQKATVIIDPPALGRVEVEVRATSTGIEASFKVDSAQVRDMIRPQIPVLQDMLSQQGIVASSISVDIRQGDERRSPWRDSLDSIKLRRRRGTSDEDELEIPSMDIARLDMEKGVLQWYA